MNITTILQSLPWRRALLIAFGGLLSYILIPLGLVRYSEIKSLHDARLAKAVKFADQNAAFTSKVNATATLLRLFANHNTRIKLSSLRLPEADKELYAQFQGRRLELDEATWWWPSEFARETRALDLLSTDELKQLDELIKDYKASELTTVNQVTYLWEFFDSPDYCVSEQSDRARQEIEAKVGPVFENEYNARNELVTRVLLLFSKSNHRTSLRNLVGP